MYDFEYERLLQTVLNCGKVRGDRTGTGTIGIFGAQMRFDLSESFPLLTSKRVFMKGIIHELLWFLQGETNIKYLVDNDVHIWDEWADENGELGPVYGSQWRSWPSIEVVDRNGEYPSIAPVTPKGQVLVDTKSLLVYTNPIDQITKLIDSLKNNPNSRRHIVSAWNPAEVDNMALPPCHCLFQFYVREEQNNMRYLDCQLYQRSADMFLGVPFNIASYALLTYMVAQVCGYTPGEFIHTLGDAHIYTNHVDQVKEQLDRCFEESDGLLFHVRTKPMADYPKLLLNPAIKDIFGFSYSDFILEDYNPLPAIKAPISV